MLSTLPDRQITYLLYYLRDKLRADQYLRQALQEIAPEIVDGCLARAPIRSTVYKGEPMFELHSASLPYLALWREGGKLDYRLAGGLEVQADCQLAWLSRIPGEGPEHDRETWGNTLANTVFDRASRYLFEIPLETRNKAGIGSVMISSYELLPFGSEGFCGFSADLSMRQTKPPYQVDDLDEIRRIAMTIQLYDSATVGGDGIQGDYIGPDLEAHIE